METGGWGRRRSRRCCCCGGKGKSESPRSPPQYLPPPTRWQVLQDVRTGEFSCRTTRPVCLYSSAPRWRTPYISYEDRELARIFEKQKVRPPVLHNSFYHCYSTLRAQPPPPPPRGEVRCKYAVWAAWAAATVVGNAVAGSLDGCWVVLALFAAALLVRGCPEEGGAYQQHHCAVASLKQVLKNAAILLAAACVLGAGVWAYFFVGEHLGGWVADAVLLVLAVAI